MANRRLAVSDQTGEKIKQLAKKRGVTIGAYMDWLIRFVEENPIDQEAALENKYFPLLRKEIERVIAILRRIEKDSIIPTNLGVKTMVQHLAEVLPEDDERGEQQSAAVAGILVELEQTKAEADKVPKLKSENEVLRERLRLVMSNLKWNRRGNGGMVELTQMDVNAIEAVLKG